MSELPTFYASTSIPLIGDIVEGSVDFQHQPVHRSSSGGWKSAFFITAAEVAERFAYYGISSNLITYLSEELGESTATAAANVNTWSGTATLLPLLGAFVADSFLGRYCTIIVASLIYVVGLALLTLSTLLPDISHYENCRDSMPCSAAQTKVILFFFAIYLVALGEGGHKPCLQAFGADQFDELNVKENKAKSSFFNWWYFSLSASALTAIAVVVYIQDNFSWTLGFGIPCIVMIVGLVVFLLGRRTYRYIIKKNEQNPFTRIGYVVFRAIQNRRLTLAASASGGQQDQLYDQVSKKYGFLYKALLTSDGLMDDQMVSSLKDVEEAKALLGLLPIWATCLTYAIVFAQTSTFFTKQGITMDRTIFSGFKIPAASLQLFIGVAIIIFVPLYDRIFVPIARAFTHRPSGITMLQRIGFGMCVSIISMVIAAFVEMRRIAIAKENGIVDLSKGTIPMSIWWLLPQYLLCGFGEVFTVVGLQEFFYDQIPKELRSVGLSLYLSVLGIGSFLSGFLVSVIDKATNKDGEGSWFSNNVYRVHIDYFYWILAAISAIGFMAYLYCARSYVYVHRCEGRS